MKVKLMCSVLMMTLAGLAGPFDKAVLHGETNRDDFLAYEPNEEIAFTLTLQGARPFPAGAYFIQWTRTGDDGETRTGREPLSATKPLVVRTRLAKPGFVRLEAKVVDARGRGVAAKRTVAFDGGAGVQPEKLQSVPEPADFDAFWAARRARLAKVPMKPVVKEHPSRNSKVRILSFTVPCAGPRPVTGTVTVPRNTSRKYPAHITFHGYGAAFVQGIPRTGPENEILMFINAHGYELGREKEYYTEFYNSLKCNDRTFALDSTWQNKSTDTAYFGSMIYRIMRALEYLKSFPEWNGRDLIASGGSMGGLQTIWAAGIDSAVTLARPSIPWCCDVGGRDTLGRLRLPAQIAETPALRYFDPVNFAKRIAPTCRVEVPRAGLGDYVSPPSGIAVFYNNVRGAKKCTWVQGSDHGYVPRERHQVVVREK